MSDAAPAGTSEGAARADALLSDYLRQSSRGRKLGSSGRADQYPAGRAILAAGSAVQIAAIRAALATISRPGVGIEALRLYPLVRQLCRRHLPFTDDDLGAIITSLIR